ncbi:MAG: tRNA 4-thiouridine(8) synthase ThiI [Clostridia bacterium]|nr:tRNA 4-thiouridine(8) synthase ThiI [Clostridia bacterium]
MEQTNKVILLKLGEVVLKGLNRKNFEKMLIDDVKRRLKKCGNYSVLSSQSTMYVSPLDSDSKDAIDDAAKECAKVFGVASLCVAAEIEKDLDKILAFIGNYVRSVRKDEKTFKVVGKRSDKTFPLTSPELSALCGAKILSANHDMKVDVSNPDMTVYVEVRDYAVYIHASKIHGAGGMPAGSAGKAVLLLSGGIDSPAAGYVCAKRGVMIEALHFDSFPYTSERARMKVIELAEKMCDYCGNISLNIISLTEIQESIKKVCKEDYFTVILRRFMMRLAEMAAKNSGAKAIITGESLGQVASQTMSALAVTNNAVSDIPVFRPFIAMDKEEIVNIARKIGTFDISIQPYEDCCTVFTPKHPATSPILEKVLFEEQKLDVKGLTERAFATMEKINLNPGN